MGAVAADLLDTIVTALKAVNGTGEYTHNLSGTEPVRVGTARIGIPPTVPFVTVVPELIQTKRSTVINFFRRDGTFRIVGWGKTTADTDIARIKAALNMANDILRAVESDTTLGGLSYDLKASARSFVSFEPETGSEYPVAVVDVEVWYRTSAGM